MKYVIGVDFGTLSARALLVEAESGMEICDFVSEYRHAVMDTSLPSGKKLTRNFALQIPSDYIDALSESVRGVLKKTGLSPSEVVGLGIDFTSSTLLPIDKNGTPLCESEKYKDEPHAYVKLWKHCSAYKEAEEITELAKKRGEKWLNAYGGKLSAELSLPKILETLRCAPEVYNDAYRFIEAGDWLSLILTGEETRSPAFAGYKALYQHDTGYPSNDFYKALDPRLDGIIGNKIPKEVAASISERAGVLNKRGSEITGLSEGTVLALPMIDAHASMAGLNVTEDGDIVMIIGTSSCHIMNSSERTDVKGIFGYVKDGVIPGLYTYEAGQSAVGDSFDWFVKNCVPSSYEKEAEEMGISIHKLLREKAKKLAVGESGLVALDWWSGNRSILADYSLTGMICGFTLRTRPEEIYRALIESTAFGTRVIHEQFEKQGVKINKITATGGITAKDEFMMQIYADVLGKDIFISQTKISGALGSAVYAAAAAGEYPSIRDAAAAFAKPYATVYRPIPENQKAYSKLYKKYKELHDTFGVK